LCGLVQRDAVGEPPVGGAARESSSSGRSNSEGVDFLDLANARS
jgi:hypothetical protein